MNPSLWMQDDDWFSRGYQSRCASLPGLSSFRTYPVPNKPIQIKSFQAGYDQANIEFLECLKQGKKAKRMGLDPSACSFEPGPQRAGWLAGYIEP